MEGLPARAALLHSGRPRQGSSVERSLITAAKVTSCGMRFGPPRAILPKEVRAMAIIPEKYLDLLQRKKAFANLATLMPDGTPQVTPVWCDYKDGLVRVNTATGRGKARNLKKGAPVGLAIADPDNPYRYVQIRGRVRLVTEDGAAAHIDSLAKKYLGQDKYPYAAGESPGQAHEHERSRRR